MAFGVFVSLSIPVISLTGISDAPAYLSVTLPLPTTTLTYTIETVGELKPRFSTLGNAGVFRAAFEGGQYGLTGVVTSEASCAFEGRVASTIDPLQLLTPSAACSFVGSAPLPATFSQTLPRVACSFAAVPTISGSMQAAYRPVLRASLNGLAFNNGALVVTLPAHVCTFNGLTKVDAGFTGRLKRVAGRFRGVRV